MKQNFIPNAQELFAALWNPLARILVILLVVSAWCFLCGGYFFSKGRIAAASFTSRWWLWVQRPLPGTQPKGLSGKSVTMLILYDLRLTSNPICLKLSSSRSFYLHGLNLGPVRLRSTTRTFCPIACGPVWQAERGLSQSARLITIWKYIRPQSFWVCRRNCDF